MGTGKLRVDLANGVFDVEGGEDFVREMHAEFQSYISDFFKQKRVDNSPAPANIDESNAASDAEGGVDDKPKSRRNGTRRKKAAADSSTGGRSSAYEPRFLPDVDFKDLPEHLAKFEAKTQKDRILIFGDYVQNTKGINPFSADHIFTCYRFAKEKPPQAFAKAIRDARSVHHFFKFDDITQISLTHIGETHVAHDIARA